MKTPPQKRITKASRSFLFAAVYLIFCIAAVMILRTLGIKVVITVAFISCAAVWVWIMIWLDTKNRLDFSKILVGWSVLHGTGMGWASIYLAYTGADNIAETLAVAAVVQLVATPTGYFIKAGIENLSKHNTWPDKPNNTGGDGPP